MGIRFSDMESASTFQANDIVPIVSDGENKIVTGEKIKQYAAGDKQDSLTGGTISTGDLNDYTTAGSYYVNSSGASVVQNLPIALAGYLEVIQPSSASSGTRLQRYTAIEGVLVTHIYERNFNSGSWRAWQEILLINAPTLETFDSVAVTSGAHVTIGSITPPEGTYLINAGVAFPHDATGIRRILLSRASSSTNTPNLVDSSPALIQATEQAAGISSSYTQAVRVTTIATVNATYPTIYMRAYQNSGESMTVNGAIQYMRIS